MHRHAFFCISYIHIMNDIYSRKKGGLYDCGQFVGGQRPCCSILAVVSVDINSKTPSLHSRRLGVFLDGLRYVWYIHGVRSFPGRKTCLEFLKFHGFIFPLMITQLVLTLKRLQKPLHLWRVLSILGAVQNQCGPSLR